jgi:hypothetical protein
VCSTILPLFLLQRLPHHHNPVNTTPRYRCRYRCRCGGLKPLHLPHSSWRYFRRKLRSWAPNRSPATVCSGQILCLPLYLSIFIVTLPYIHTYSLQGAAVDIAKWTQDYLSRSCSGILQEWVWRQTIHIHTYIHTYIHTHKHLFLHSSQAATAIMGGGCPSLPPTAEDAHALGDTSRSMGGAQQEVF